jgi:hypothetical protein
MSNVLEKQMYAGMLAVINDKDCYYTSSVGHHHNKLTSEGEEAIVAFLKQFAPLMLKQQEKELDIRAKKMMWEELKK